jgi:glycosyltransferase involved in cell wall biosynthesis
MDFVFYSQPTFEPWDWNNPETVGIGGSETSHIEMARRLNERGHEVFSYAPIRNKSVGSGRILSKMGPAGVKWAHSNNANFAKPGVLVIYRDPEILDRIGPGRAAWLIFQDVHYGNKLTEARASKLTRLVALCEEHANKLRSLYPFAAHKVCVSSNGTLVKDNETFPNHRNPRRMMFASSPDRGLNQCLQIFGRVKEVIPDAELHIYYGWDNIDKVIARGGSWGQEVLRRKNYTIQLIEKTGAQWHGRTGQGALKFEWSKAGIWCHPSNFTETSCITCMDAQALGAIPVTIPTWAVGENVKHGVFIEGDAGNSLTRSRFVLEVIGLMLDPERQDIIREDMMPWARERFGWDRFVTQWERWATQDMVFEPPPLIEYGQRKAPQEACA